MTSSSSTVWAQAAVVTGAAHLRVARNGQDAAACWVDGAHAVAVVCDGCGSSPRSELGAQLVARAMCAQLARRLRAGASVAEPALWAACRGEVSAELARLARTWCVSQAPAHQDAALPAEAVAAVAQALLCTVLVAALDEQHAAVWALGDGAFVLDGALTVLGPFADNAPPYLAYDLLGPAHLAHLAVRPRGTRGVVAVATDGAAELGDELAALVAQPRSAEHPDALRRQLTTLARPGERIVWSERRVERTAARLQDDAAVALLRWGPPASQEERS